MNEEEELELKRGESGEKRRISKVEVGGWVDKRRFSKLEVGHLAGAMEEVTKAKFLEQNLRGIYCRPMIKMFKYFNSDDMMVLETPDFDEVLYTEMTKTQLTKHQEMFEQSYKEHNVPKTLNSHLLFDNF